MNDFEKNNTELWNYLFVGHTFLFIIDLKMGFCVRKM